MKIDFLPGDIVRIEAWDTMKQLYAYIDGKRSLVGLDDDMSITALSLGRVHDPDLSAFYPEPTDTTPNWQVFIVLSWNDDVPQVSKSGLMNTWMKRGMFIVTNMNDFAYVAASRIDLS